MNILSYCDWKIWPISWKFLWYVIKVRDLESNKIFRRYHNIEWIYHPVWYHRVGVIKTMHAFIKANMYHQNPNRLNENKTTKQILWLGPHSSRIFLRSQITWSHLLGHFAVWQIFHVNISKPTLYLHSRWIYSLCGHSTGSHSVIEKQ